MKNEYKTLSIYECIQNKLNNEVIQNNDLFLQNYEEFYVENGSEYDDWIYLDGTQDYKDFSDFYLLSYEATQELINHTYETIYYNNKIGLYVWAIESGCFTVSWYNNKEQDTMKDNEVLE